MFGYVKPYAPDLYVREYELYRATYCGVCKSMRRHTGLFSTLTLSYDSVFLALVRMLYGDRKTEVEDRRCIAHPFRRRKSLRENAALEYTARVSAILIAENIRDDLHDRGFFKRLRALLLYPYAAHAARRARMPALRAELREILSRIYEMERRGESSVDTVASAFGELLGRVFCAEIREEDRETLYDIGHALGCYIYAADAAEDYEDDRRRGAYNPYVLAYGGAPLTDERRSTIHTSLLLTLQRLSSALEYLPLDGADAVEHILKNTVYVGLPNRLSFLQATPPDEKKGSK